MNFFFWPLPDYRYQAFLILQTLNHFPTEKVVLIFFKRRKKIPQVLKKPTEKLGQQGFIMVVRHKNTKWHGCLMMEIEHSII
jgi:hypothetical protein